MAILEIGLLGFGTVSSGFYHRLEAVKEKIYQRTGFQPVVSKILMREGRGSDLPEAIQKLLVYDINDILEDSKIQVVVEAINGEEPAATYLHEALIRGKHVITANKAALAGKWEALHTAALQGDCFLYYEASVCAGIPLIQTIETISHSDQIISIEGIVNGTSNYILTEMAQRGLSYEQALIQATALGYAEADPSADVDGLDAANKLSILCGLGFDSFVAPIDISKETIRGLEQAELGLKLIASATRVNNGVKANVALKTLSETHPLYAVNGVDNGVVIVTQGIGEIKLIGPGAGSLPTGTAMVSDLFRLAERIADKGGYLYE